MSVVNFRFFTKLHPIASRATASPSGARSRRAEVAADRQSLASGRRAQSPSRHIRRVSIRVARCLCAPRSRSPAATGAGFFIPTALVWFAERGCPQANRVTLTDSCRSNNSLGDDFQHQFRLAGVVKLFESSFESFTHRRKRLGFKLSRFYEGLD
jgi:hypothetical protein